MVHGWVIGPMDYIRVINSMPVILWAKKTWLSFCWP